MASQERVTIHSDTAVTLNPKPAERRVVKFRPEVAEIEL